MFADANGFPMTGIAELSRPIESNTEDIEPSDDTLLTFPNPSFQRVTLRLDLSTRAELQISLLDQGGRFVHELFKGVPKKGGPIDISFDVDHLEPGIYFVHAQSNGSTLTPQKIVVQ